MEENDTEKKLGRASQQNKKFSIIETITEFIFFIWYLILWLPYNQFWVTLEGTTLLTLC